jgi:hypothetical protein
VGYLFLLACSQRALLAAAARRGLAASKLVSWWCDRGSRD